MIRHRPLGLRARFLVASTLLVLSTIVASTWTLFSLGQIGGVADTMVVDSDETTAATTALASALEREDDALLLVWSEPKQPHDALSRTRLDTDAALDALTARLARNEEHGLARELSTQIAAYRARTDALLALGEAHPLERYHAEVNPLLRRAVGTITSIRDRHFEQMRDAAALARRGVLETRNIAVMVSVLALGVSVLVALRLARDIITPLRELERGVSAVREGDFDSRVAIGSPRELATVADAFNEMAARLSSFRRSNLAEVLRAKATLEAILQALPDAVVLLGPRRSVTTMNPAAERLFRECGLPPPESQRDLEVLGIHVDHLRPRGDEKAATGLDLAVACPLPQRDGERRILPRVVPIERDDGHDGSIVIALYDVTDLARLDEMRAELVAVASHELRTPVTTLRMTLLMMREMADALEPRLRELVDTALFGVDQLAETVGELLDLTHLEAGRIELDRERVDLAAVVAETERRWRSAAEDAALRLKVQSETEDAAMIYADRSRMRIVLDNLVGNAVKYTPAGGEIEVGVFVTDDDGPPRVGCRVTDTGPGIPEAYRERVFEKFFRVEQLRKGAEGTPRGSGIGLYLCKQLVELHGGTIRYEPAETARGSRFVFELPASRPSPDA